MKRVPRIAVIGGGIAGLAAAFRIREEFDKRSAGIELELFEGRTTPGGNIRTERADGYTCEHGPNGFLDSVPATLDLIERLGLTDRLFPATDAANRRYLYRHGSLHPLPMSPIGFLRSGVLSLPGRLRCMAEPFQKQGAAARNGEDESIYDFASRRVGPEAASILIDAMVSGIFAADVRALSLPSAFPKMREMEANYGTLVRAMMAKKKEARKSGRKAGSPGGFGGTLTTFRSGLDELTGALAASLGESVNLGLAGRRLSRRNDVWTLQFCDGSSRDFDSVVVASPAWEAARLFDQTEPELAGDLAAIPSSPIAVVALGLNESDLGRPLDGFGFLVPRGTGPRILGSLWTSSIWPGRAPEGRALLRCMIGGAHDPDAVESSDDQLVEAVLQDIRPILQLRGDPEWRRIFRYSRGIPQYNVGHGARLDRIEGRLSNLPGIYLTGNSYRGIAINACIEEAGRIACRVSDDLN